MGEEITFIAKNLQGVEIGRIVQKIHDIAWELLKIEDKYQIMFNKDITDQVIRTLIFSSLLAFALTSKRLDRHDFDTLS